MELTLLIQELQRQMYILKSHSTLFFELTHRKKSQVDFIDEYNDSPNEERYQRMKAIYDKSVR